VEALPDGSQAPEEQPRKISPNLQENVDILNGELGVKASFDMICRELRYGGKDFALYFLDGFAKDDVMNGVRRPTSSSPTSKTSPTRTSWTSNEAVLVTSVAAIGTFATPSYELSLANQMVRLGLIVLAGIFGPLGFLIGLALWIVMLLRTRSLGTSYLWPLVPFNGRALLHIVLRPPVFWSSRRPSFLHVKDKTRR
jgi:hypothetical protein